MTAKQSSAPPDEVLKCPHCGQALPFQDLEWQEELETLLAKYAGSMGISPNLAGFSLVEQRQHYKALKRLEASQ